MTGKNLEQSFTTNKIERKKYDRNFYISHEINTAVSGRDFLIHKRMEDLLWGIILCLKKFSREVQKLKCDP